MEKNFTTGSVLKGIIFFHSHISSPIFYKHFMVWQTYLLLDSLQMFLRQLLYLLAHSLCIFLP